MMRANEDQMRRNNCRFRFRHFYATPPFLPRSIVDARFLPCQTILAASSFTPALYFQEDVMASNSPCVYARAKT